MIFTRSTLMLGAALLAGGLAALFAAAPELLGGRHRPTTYYVSPAGRDSHSGTRAERPLASIQRAVERARPGDSIRLAPGRYAQDVISQRDGAADAPITISGPADAVLTGAGRARVVELNHSYLTLQGFTIDGLWGAPDAPAGFREKLLYVVSRRPEQGVTGVRVLGLTLRNAGGECLRLRYQAHNNEVAGSRFERCGVHDFVFHAGKRNGEAIYIGTAPEQRDNGANPTAAIDRSNDNWVHDNSFDTQGNECVDIKEGSSGNLVERNRCTGQRDPNSAGFDARGSGNIFRYNESYGNVGAGIRLGGDGPRDGVDNQVYGNDLHDNRAGGIKVVRQPQLLCGNTLRGNRGGKLVGGGRGAPDPARACPQLQQDAK